jgi:hypothetical protein
MTAVTRSVDGTALSAVVLAVGVALGGWFVGHGFLRGRTASRYVEVKGLAEREVTADLALWPLRFVSTGDDLAVAQAEITRDTREVYSFLARHGIDTTAVQLLAGARAGCKHRSALDCRARAARRRAPGRPGLE